MNTLQASSSTKATCTYLTLTDYMRLVDLVLQQRANGKTDKNLNALADVLKRATKVASTDILGTVVTMNSRVVLEDLRTGESKELSIVYPKVADIQQLKISVLAPIAIAVLGRKVGDTVEWPVPSGVTRYVIASISYQPEAEGDYHL